MRAKCPDSLIFLDFIVLTCLGHNNELLTFTGFREVNYLFSVNLRATSKPYSHFKKVSSEKMLLVFGQTVPGSFPLWVSGPYSFLSIPLSQIFNCPTFYCMVLQLGL
jgi:hypothetical protein